MSAQMGMLDWYRPVPDGPCGLFVWKQGEAAPIGQGVDEECRLTPARLSQRRLPPQFEIYSYDLSLRPVIARMECGAARRRGVGTHEKSNKLSGNLTVLVLTLSLRVRFS
jgi:hypothetical protein